MKKSKKQIKNYFKFRKLGILIIVSFFLMTSNEVQAVNYLTNPSFTGGTTGWTLSNSVYDPTYFQDTAGSLRIETVIGAKNSVVGTGSQLIATPITAGDTVFLNAHWSKQCISSACKKYKLSIQVARPAHPNNWIDLWTNKGVPSPGAPTPWTQIGIDVTSLFSGTGTYNFRVMAEMENNGKDANSQAIAWFDNLSLDINGINYLFSDIVDRQGNSIPSPSIDFTPVDFSWNSSPQVATGILGINTPQDSQIIRLNNGTINPVWNLNIAGSEGALSLWQGTEFSYDFNGSISEGRMHVDLSSITITPKNKCTSTGISLGTSAYFEEGVIDSITVASADATADSSCYWDLTNILLSQEIPPMQEGDNYTLSLVFTAV